MEGTSTTARKSSRPIISRCKFRSSRGSVRCAHTPWLNRNRRVKELVPQHKLASFNLEDGFGWEQLCPVLGVPIPDVPYPVANTPERFDKMQAGFVKKAMRKAYALIGTTILVPNAGVAAWYFLRRHPARGFAALPLFARIFSQLELSQGCLLLSFSVLYPFVHR